MLISAMHLAQTKPFGRLASDFLENLHLFETCLVVGQSDLNSASVCPTTRAGFSLKWGWGSESTTGAASTLGVFALW